MGGFRASLLLVYVVGALAISTGTGDHPKTTGGQSEFDAEWQQLLHENANLISGASAMPGDATQPELDESAHSVNSPSSLTSADAEPSNSAYQSMLRGKLVAASGGDSVSAHEHDAGSEKGPVDATSVNSHEGGHGDHEAENGHDKTGEHGETSVSAESHAKAEPKHKDTSDKKNTDKKDKKAKKAEGGPAALREADERNYEAAQEEPRDSHGHHDTTADKHKLSSDHHAPGKAGEKVGDGVHADKSQVGAADAQKKHEEAAADTEAPVTKEESEAEKEKAVNEAASEERESEIGDGASVDIGGGDDDADGTSGETADDYSNSAGTSERILAEQNIPSSSNETEIVDSTAVAGALNSTSNHTAPGGLNQTAMPIGANNTGSEPVAQEGDDEEVDAAGLASANSTTASNGTLGGNSTETMPTRREIREQIREDNEDAENVDDAISDDTRMRREAEGRLEAQHEANETLSDAVVEDKLKDEVKKKQENKDEEEEDDELEKKKEEMEKVEAEAEKEKEDVKAEKARLDSDERTKAKAMEKQIQDKNSDDTNSNAAGERTSGDVGDPVEATNSTSSAPADGEDVPTTADDGMNDITSDVDAVDGVGNSTESASSDNSTAPASPLGEEAVKQPDDSTPASSQGSIEEEADQESDQQMKESSVPDTDDEHEYFIMLDAGSVRTKLAISMHYPKPRGDADAKARTEMMEIDDSYVTQTTPGLVSYLDNLDQIEDALHPLLETAQNSVPPAKRSSTPVAVFLTGEITQQSRQKVSLLLDEIRSVMATYPFEFHYGYVRIMPGDDKAAYTWISANEGFKRLDEGANTLGVISLGSQETVVAYQPTKDFLPLDPNAGGYNISLAAVKHDLFAYGYAGLGMESSMKGYYNQLVSSSETPTVELEEELVHALEGAAMSPCLLLGDTKEVGNGAKVTTVNSGKHGETLVIGGDFKECVNDITTMVVKGEREVTSFGKTSLKSTANEPLPPSKLTENGPVLLARGFFYMSRFFGIMGEQTVDVFKTTGENYCGISLATARKEYKGVLEKYYSTFSEEKRDEYLKSYCYGLSLTYSLLTEAYGLKDSDNVNIVDSTGGHTIDWPSGAIMWYSSEHHEEGEVQTVQSTASTSQNTAILASIALLAMQVSALALCLGIVVRKLILLNEHNEMVDQIEDKLYQAPGYRS